MTQSMQQINRYDQHNSSFALATGCVCIALALVLFGMLAPVMADEPVPLELRDLNGNPHTPLASSSGRGIVLFYLMTDCPISNAYSPEIQRIVDDFASQGIAFYIVYVDSDATDVCMRAHSKDYSLECTILLDPEQQLLERHQVDVAPQAILLDSKGQRLYQGRIDDLYSGFGKRRAKATEHYLRDAISAYLAGEPILQASVKPIGCSVIRKSK